MIFIKYKLKNFNNKINNNSTKKYNSLKNFPIILLIFKNFRKIKKF